jgi:hypothetical protein
MVGRVGLGGWLAGIGRVQITVSVVCPKAPSPKAPSKWASHGPAGSRRVFVVGMVMVPGAGLVKGGALRLNPEGLDPGGTAQRARRSQAMSRATRKSRRKARAEGATAEGATAEGATAEGAMAEAEAEGATADTDSGGTDTDEGATADTDSGGTDTDSGGTDTDSEG